MSMNNDKNVTEELDFVLDEITCCYCGSPDFSCECTEENHPDNSDALARANYIVFGRYRQYLISRR